MAWQPAPESLRQLASCLKNSLSGFNRATQIQAEAMLEQAKTSPDFNNYLAYLFSSSTPPDGVQLTPAEYHLVRSAAAIMIKNNVRIGYKSLSEPGLGLIKMAVSHGIQDANSQIRNYAGNIATEIVVRGGLMSWPELLPRIIDIMVNASGRETREAQEGAVSTMAKICEDNVKTIQRDHNGQRPLQFILPSLLAATKSPIDNVRAKALTAINVFTQRKTQVMLDSTDDLLARLFALAADKNADVRRQVCRAFVHLVDTRPDRLQPHIEGLVDYMIGQQKSDDDELACEAAEFWLSVGEHTDLWQALRPYIQRIIPVLLECMVYSGEEIALLGGASDDDDEEDRQQDIKPMFAKKTAGRTVNGKGKGKGKAKAKGQGQGGGAAAAAGAAASLNQQQSDGSGDPAKEEGEIDEHHNGGPDDDDDEDDNAGADERWTIRKCSAASLDVFARDFEEPVFQCIMPYLTNNLKHSEWPLREAAVLALGAIADGCMRYVAPHLPELVPYLITLLEDEEPVVRKITCWTLGRYSRWAAILKDQNQRVTYFEPMVDGLLRKMLDRNKKVQEAAASAFANLEEKAGRALEPYCGPIIQQYVCCFDKYKDKNMYILYDCVQTLAEHMGPALAAPDRVGRLMPALLARYQAVPNESREMFPLLECLSYVALALNDAFAPFARPIFIRCVQIIHANLEQAMAAANDPNLDQPDKDFLVTSLDLLGAIVQCLNDGSAAELVKETQPSFFELMTLCLEDPADEVRQSAYALLGDCSKAVFSLMQPHLGAVLPILVRQMDLDNILDEDADGALAVINNACWAVGEIAMRHGKNMAPFVPDLLGRCREILGNPLVPRTVSENAAIAIGRMGLEYAEQLAPALPTFAPEFLSVMSDVDSSEEKATAFKGFTMVVGQNPQAMEKVLLQFFVAIARYRDIKLRNPIKQDLHDIFQSAINAYKQMIPQFGNFIGQMQTRDQQLLKESYVV